MTEFLLLAFILLVAGVDSVPIASRFGLGSVLGYLLAGMAIAPLLGFLGVDVVQLQHFAEFGVVMMLFIIGLELAPKWLWAMRKRLIGLGGGQSGIRTLEGLAPLPVFKTGAFNHSANCPFESPASVSFRHCHPQTSA